MHEIEPGSPAFKSIEAIAEPDPLTLANNKKLVEAEGARRRRGEFKRARSVPREGERKQA
jgi:hypothetical protein